MYSLNLTLISFVESLSAERMDAFTNLPIAQTRALDELRDEFRIMHESQAQDQQRLIMASIKLQQYINHLRHIDKLRQSVELLLQGILTPQLVPKITLRTTLLDIKSHLRRHFPQSHLIFERASDYNAMRNLYFYFGGHDRHLLILFQVPITTFDYDFKIFKVTSFSVPITDRPSQHTTILGLPNYFVASRHSPHYFTSSHDDSSIHPTLICF